MTLVYSRDIVGDTQAAVIEKTGIISRLLNRVKTMMSTMIDRLSYDLTRQQYSSDRMSSSLPQYVLGSFQGQQTRAKLNTIFSEILTLFRPIAIWSLSHPYFKLKRVSISGESVEFKDNVVRQAGEAFESFSFKVKNFLRPSTISHVLKRSNDHSTEEKIRYLLAYQKDFHQRNPTASIKMKLKYGWSLVCTKVLRQYSQSGYSRIQKRAFDASFNEFYAALQVSFDESLWLSGV